MNEIVITAKWFCSIETVVLTLNFVRFDSLTITESDLRWLNKIEEICPPRGRRRQGRCPQPISVAGVAVTTIFYFTRFETPRLLPVFRHLV